MNSYRLMLESSLDGLIDQAYEEASDGVDVSSGSIAADENVRGAFKADIVREVSRMLETSARTRLSRRRFFTPHQQAISSRASLILGLKAHRTAHLARLHCKRLFV